MKVNNNKSDLCSGTPIKKTEMTIKTPQLIPGRQTARKYRIFWYRPNSPNRIRISSKFIAVPWWHFLTPPMPDFRGRGDSGPSIILSTSVCRWFWIHHLKRPFILKFLRCHERYSTVEWVNVEYKCLYGANTVFDKQSHMIEAPPPSPRFTELRFCLMIIVYINPQTLDKK